MGELPAGPPEQNLLTNIPYPCSREPDGRLGGAGCTDGFGKAVQRADLDADGCDQGRSIK